MNQWINLAPWNLVMENRPFADGLFLAVRERFYRWTFRFTASSQRKQHRHVSTCVSHKCPQHGMTRTPRKITQLMIFLPYIPIMSYYIYIHIHVCVYIYIYELYICISTSPWLVNHIAIGGVYILTWPTTNEVAGCQLWTRQRPAMPCLMGVKGLVNRLKDTGTMVIPHGI